MAEKNNRLLGSDFITNKLLTVLFLACAYMVFITLIRAGLRSSAFRFVYTGLKVIMFASLALAVFGIVKAIIDKKKDDGRKRIFTGGFIAGCAVLLAYVCYRMAYTNYVSAMKFLYVLILILCVLYMIYIVYKREFFVTALAGAVVALYIWRYARYAVGSTGFIVCQIVLLAALAILIALMFTMYLSGGTIRIGGTKYRFMSPDAEYKPTLIGLGILALIVAALFFVPAEIMIYLAYAAAALVFALAVYFTIVML